MNAPNQYFVFSKPYDVLSQFTRELPSHRTLADYIQVDRDVYPIGRLDKDSEGLLLLTNDNRLKNQLLDPKSKSPKSYWAQVDGNITEEAVQNLKQGVNIKLKKGKYTTHPCSAKIIESPDIDERQPPIRIRKNIPTSWVQITLTEGKNRQVRKMCAAVGFPCLRLVRAAIKGVQFRDVQVGTYRSLLPDEIRRLTI